MSGDDASPAHGDPGELQFDHVETGRSRGGAAAAPGVRCRLCKKAVGDEYYAVKGRLFCARCTRRLIAAATTRPSLARVGLTVLFGLAAAIAGAALYYVVYARMHVQIGIVAIAAGYMVGYAVRKGSGRRGGRWLQILAVVLAYSSVDLAYVLIWAQQHVEVPRIQLVALPIVTIVRTLPL